MIVVPPRCHPAPREGIRFLRCPLTDAELVEIDGVHVTGPVRTAFDLARASTVEEGLVATDVLCRQLGLAPALVLDYALGHPRMGGVPVARETLALTDPRSRSSGESRLRYIWGTARGPSRAFSTVPGPRAPGPRGHGAWRPGPLSRS